MVVAVLLKQFVEQVQDMEFNRSLQVVVGDSGGGSIQQGTVEAVLLKQFVEQVQGDD
jgi:hypothetical protein